jgi:hypothetical protein
MKVLLVGVGTVGEAMRTAPERRMKVRPWLEQMVLAGRNFDRVRDVADSIGDSSSHPVAQPRCVGRSRRGGARPGL